MPYCHAAYADTLSLLAVTPRFYVFMLMPALMPSPTVAAYAMMPLRYAKFCHAAVLFRHMVVMPYDNTDVILNRDGHA